MSDSIGFQHSSKMVEKLLDLCSCAQELDFSQTFLGFPTDPAWLQMTRCSQQLRLSRRIVPLSRVCECATSRLPWITDTHSHLYICRACLWRVKPSYPSRSLLSYSHTHHMKKRMSFLRICLSSGGLRCNNYVSLTGDIFVKKHVPLELLFLLMSCHAKRFQEGGVFLL